MAYDPSIHDKGREDSDNLLLRMVEGLEEKYRLPVYLYYFEGYHSAEIAKMLHVNASTLRSRLAKARKLLKLELESEKNQEGNMRKAW